MKENKVKPRIPKNKVEDKISKSFSSAYPLSSKNGDLENYSGGNSENSSDQSDEEISEEEDAGRSPSKSELPNNSSNIIVPNHPNNYLDALVEQEWSYQTNKVRFSSTRAARDDEMETSFKKRVVFLNDDLRNAKYPYLPNYIKTTKYTLYSFLPVALLLQFMRVANVYFLIIAILQSIPAISPLNPFTAAMPLAFVLWISLIREAVEDYRRYRADRKTNMMKFSKLVIKGSQEEIQSKDIKIGDILVVYENDTFPSDLVLLKSSGGQNAFIQTSSLDGEKNLKKRNIPINFEDYVKPPEEKDLPLVGKLVTEPPSADLYNFTGKLVVGQDQFSLNINQLLLKGATLKNTEWVLGVVVFTGRDTKLMMNSQKSRTKQSNVEKKLNIVIFIILLIQIWICFILAIITLIYDKTSDDDQDGYLGDGNTDQNYVFNFFAYFLLLNTMIPISLIVTLEIIKVFQCIFMTWDSEMFSIDDGAGCHVSSTTINEELGQVTYIFSDKTGTLTQNIMEFKALWVETEIYGSIGDQLRRRLSKLESISEIGFGFHSQKLDIVLDPDHEVPEGFPLIIKSKNGSDSYTLKNDREKAIEVIKLLALWHECMPEFTKIDEVETMFYQGPSPDETTLVDFAQKRGFEFCKSTDTTMTIKYYPESGLWSDDKDFIEKTYDIHRKMEFNSDRKRMSVLFTDWDDGKYKLFIKGADSIIKERLSKNSKNIEKIDDFLVRSSVRGLRTLLLAVRILDKKEFNEIMNEIADAEDDIMNRDKLLQKVFDKYERELILLGATAVEDRLQDDVPTILEDFRLSGIKVWMLTGDKLETAKNIGYSCKLLTDEMVITEAKGADEAHKVFTPELVEDNDLMLKDLK